MLSRLETLIDLLHSHSEAAIATQSLLLPGYPFVSAVSFATDEHHHPVLLISRLAEHTRNLAADPRASFLLARALGAGEMARVSLMGDIVPIDAEPRLVDRYLRFHPEAERFLQLGDFKFHRFEPQRILVVGGFGQAGWLEGQRLRDAPFVALDQELELLNMCKDNSPSRDTMLLGIDPYGVDLMGANARRRIAFPQAPIAQDRLRSALTAILNAD